MAAQRQRIHLFHLPPELLLHALSLSTPQACSAFSRTSRTAHSLCSSESLWRALHRAQFDDPAPSASPDDEPYPFQRIVQRRTRARALLARLQSKGEPIPSHELLELLETLVQLALSRPPSISAADASLNEAFLEAYLSPISSNILALHPTFSRRPSPGLRSNSATTSDSVSLLASRLHALSTPSPLALSSPSIRTSARECVYERLHFLRDSQYGPFISGGGGKVDWRKVEAIAMVMGANMDDARTMGWGVEDAEDGAETVVPSGWASTRSGSATATATVAARDPRDWAGIATHEWRGSYAFLDYRTYVHFNMHRSRTFVPTLAEESEAVGDCMSLKLRLLDEGEELMPPLEAFGERRGGRAGARRRAFGLDDSEDDEDEDFDVDGDLDSDASSSSDEDLESDLHTFITSRPSRVVRNLATPPTSPPSDPPTGEESSSIGPLPAPPPCSSSLSSTSSLPRPAASSFPKLSFTGTSLPLHLRSQPQPPLSFTGTFTHAHAHQHMRDRSIRGTVELNDEGAVVWRYVIRYGGMDQWAMTGVQPGGPGSKYGVLGTWTCADREAADEDGPNGPFWYWPHCKDE
ncbi:hypothetical protein JCM1840_004084 [Sporobolomyces johnsonii]